ncbi:hypothetical protein EG327_007239 [Venturia inaequalis]|uniref:Uncharacterized protein n=1 Tax=Venturia inaequalis TaxID=5025 RepID=A0A8H3VRX0_VENIN|nr:hypothetical protein EG327_007239 [Venturia inaequalis]
MQTTAPAPAPAPGTRESISVAAAPRDLARAQPLGAPCTAYRKTPPSHRNFSGFPLSCLVQSPDPLSLIDMASSSIGRRRFVATRKQVGSRISPMNSLSIKLSNLKVALLNFGSSDTQTDQFPPASCAIQITEYGLPTTLSSKRHIIIDAKDAEQEWIRESQDP